MSIELFEQLPAILPLEFFSICGSIRYAKSFPSSRAMRFSFLLPNTSEMLGEERFAQIAIAWNEEAICVEAFVEKPLEEVLFPLFSKGDALELFFDTRDLKSAGFATRFCHHFLILPESVQGIGAQEMTHFRTEDAHPLCDPKDLVAQTVPGEHSYSLRVVIPAHCLHGYDPQSCEKMGFTYRIHRRGGAPQHFAVSSQHFSLEQSPRLWASLTLKK
ncbi:MAG TPA: hypothetical protein VGJ00_10565 [Rhabdochlamydiaceae bacterium]|jgi:hypothetical protein